MFEYVYVYAHVAKKSLRRLHITFLIVAIFYIPSASDRLNIMNGELSEPWLLRVKK